MTLAEKIQAEIDRYTAAKLDLESKLALLENRLVGLQKLLNRARLIPADEQSAIIDLLS